MRGYEQPGDATPSRRLVDPQSVGHRAETASLALSPTACCFGARSTAETVSVVDLAWVDEADVSARSLRRDGERQ
jgi:hypothetical protein